MNQRHWRWHWRSMALLGLLCSAMTVAQAPEHDADRWVAGFQQVADRDLSEARDKLEALRLEALATGDGRAMVTYAQTISSHFRFSTNFEHTLVQLDELLASAALAPPQHQQIAAARVALLIHQRNLVQAQGELDVLLEQTHDEVERASLMKLQGHIRQGEGLYADAVRHYIAVLEQVGDQWPPQRLAVLYNNLGNVSHYLEDFDGAEAYFSRALAIYDELGLTRDRLLVVANLGGTLRIMGRLDEAVVLYEEGLAFVDEVAFPDLRAQFYMNLGNAYVDLGRFDEGLQATGTALAISEAHGIDYGVALSHLNIGLNHYMAGRYQDALVAYDLAYAYFSAGAGGDPSRDINRYERRQLLRNYADLYAAIGAYQQAHAYERRYGELDRALLTAEAKAASEEIQTRYETQLKDAELALNQATIVRQRGQLLALTTMLLILVSAAVVVVLFLLERNRNLQAIYERNRDLARRPAAARMPLPELELSDSEAAQARSGSSRHLFDLMVHVMEEQALFTKADLSLADLAAAVHSNTSYVSRAIAEHADSNFNGFVNTFRVQAARRMIHDNLGDIPLQQLIDQCGFNSRSSFYRSFDRLVGLSPSQYIRRSKQDANWQLQPPPRGAMEVDTQPANP